MSRLDLVDIIKHEIKGSIHSGLLRECLEEIESLRNQVVQLGLQVEALKSTKRALEQERLESSEPWT